MIKLIIVFNSLFLYLIFILDVFDHELVLLLYQLVLHDLGILECQLLPQCFNFLILLIEQIGFLLDNIRQSLALKEQFFNVGSAVMVIASMLGESGCVQARLRIRIAIKRRYIVHPVKSLHVLFMVLVTRKT